MNHKNSMMLGLLAILSGMDITGSRVLAVDAYQGADRILVPAQSWPCGMAGGIPVPEQGTLVAEATIKLNQVYHVGRTRSGQRKVYVTGEGTLTGDKLKGSFMTGGLDFELGFANGTEEIEQIFVLRTVEGNYLYLRTAGAAADPGDVRIVPEFEAPNTSSYNWLNSGKYVGRRTVDEAGKTMKLSIYDVSGLTATTNATNSITVNKPAGFPDQPWDYRKVQPGESRGEQLVTENVTLSAGERVGQARNRNRNIIPITGGTLTGKITGKVLAGGADYQNLGNPATIDARYLWQTSDGEVIIVRNAGPFASLAPTFEVRTDSSYAWLNEGKYLSSSPGMGAGGVSLTFYRSTPGSTAH